MAAQARKEVIAAIDRHDTTSARGWLDRVRHWLSEAPKTAETASDLANLSKTDEFLILNEVQAARKAAHYQQYRRNRGHDTSR
jgi:hypothetical protein